MGEEHLSKDVVAEDRRLEQATGKASEALAKHRWHWTLDETNPKRISLRQYARDVERNFRTIHGYAHGYVLFRHADADIGISEAIERAKMSGETEAATEAVAKARGVSFSTVKQDYGSQVRRVREFAREEAERKGTSVEAEVSKIAEVIFQVDRAEARDREARKRDHTRQYLEIEQCIVYALSQMKRAVTLAVEHTLPTPEQRALAASVEILRSALDTFDHALTTREVRPNWDKELQRLVGKEK